MLLLALYADRVTSGEWRDPADDHQNGTAMFSAYRHTFDRPLVRVVKIAPAAGPVEDAVFFRTRRLAAGPNQAGVLAAVRRLPRPVPHPAGTAVPGPECRGSG